MTNDTNGGEYAEEKPAPLQLNHREARVLGALMEKERSTPEAYPLTLNALTNACNQKSSRDPVMNLSQGEVGHTVRQLEGRQLIRAESSSRSERYAQKLGQELSLNHKRQALLCLLLLRGPQTVSELLNRSARLAQFSDAEDVRLSLLKLIERPTPLAISIARQTGQREERYGHLLCGEPANAKADHELDQPMPPTQANELSQLKTRVSLLEASLADLREQLGLDAEMLAQDENAAKEPNGSELD